jgi:hypothetical protein
MRRQGSRFGLPPTNHSLKHAMQDYQDVRGYYGTIALPGRFVTLSMKKQARWRWTDNHEVNPDWGISNVYKDLAWETTYDTRGGSLPDTKHPDVNTITLAYVGRYRAAKVTKSETTKDSRHFAYSASCCCGCSFCSDKPRNKAKKKTKGCRKHQNMRLADYVAEF